MDVSHKFQDERLHKNGHWCSPRKADAIEMCEECGESVQLFIDMIKVSKRQKIDRSLHKPKTYTSEYDAVTNTQPYAEDLGLE